MEHPFLWIAIPLLVLSGIGWLSEYLKDKKNES